MITAIARIRIRIPTTSATALPSGVPARCCVLMMSEQEFERFIQNTCHVDYRVFGRPSYLTDGGRAAAQTRNDSPAQDAVADSVYAHDGGGDGLLTNEQFIRFWEDEQFNNVWEDEQFNKLWQDEQLNTFCEEATTPVGQGYDSDSSDPPAKEDCGKCKNCLNKTKFGGPGLFKKACVRKCQYQQRLKKMP